MPRCDSITSLSSIQDVCSCSSAQGLPPTPAGHEVPEMAGITLPVLSWARASPLRIPTTSDVEFVPNWVLVAGNQQVLFEDSACPGNVGSRGPVRFFRTPDWLSSLFLSSAGETTITIGLIPLTTSLTEGSRWLRLWHDHRNQRFRRHSQMVDESCKVPMGRSSIEE